MLWASKIRQIINVPRIKPNNTPKELSRFFKVDFWIALENMGVNNDRKINESIKHNAIDIKISNSQFSNIISFIIGIFPKWGPKMGAKNIERMPEKTQLRIAKIS